MAIVPPPQSSNIDHKKITPWHGIPSSPPTTSRGINDTCLHRWVLLIFLETFGCMRPHDRCVLLLTNNLCVKCGALVQLSEASTLRYVGEHTSIPVPKIYCAFQHKGSAYILMDRINGKELARGWGTRSTESKEKILAQLKKMVQELRSLPPPSLRISNVDGGPVYDC